MIKGVEVMAKRINAKAEAQRVAGKMPEVGFEPVIQKQLGEVYFQLWQRGRSENMIMTVSSAVGTTYHELVNVRPTWDDVLGEKGESE